MPIVIGIGYAGRTTQEFLQELQAANVGVVVDVRAWPQSRTAPYDFNRKRIEAALCEHGIHYLWLGETLGNPKDEKGQRTLDGFDRWMQTSAYEQGIDELLHTIQPASATVALLCVERDENECHRGMILRVVRRRLAVEALPPLPAIPSKLDDLREVISILVRAAILFRGVFHQTANGRPISEIMAEDGDALAMATIFLDKWMKHLEITTDDPETLFQ